MDFKRNMHLKWLLMALLCMGITKAALCQDNSITTLDDCYQKASANYPLLKDKALLTDASDLKVKNIQTNYLPQLSLNGQMTYQSDVTQVSLPPQIGISVPGSPKDQYKVTLDAQQVIFDGGITQAQKKLEQASVATDVQQIEVDLVKVKEQVNNTYFYILILDKNRDLLSNTLNVITDRMKTTKSAVQNGVLMQSDLDALEAEELNTRQKLADIEINRKAAINILNILTGESFNDSSKLTLPETSETDTAKNKRPEYGYFDLAEQRLDAAGKVSNTSLMPKLYAFGQVGYGKPGLNMLSDKFNSYYVVGASLKWNFWDWNKSHREKQIYAIQKNQIENKRANFDKGLSIDLQNKQSAIEKYRETISNDQKIVTLRERITKTASSRLDNGVITSTEYLLELNNETMAKINLETHKIQLVQAETMYQLALGNM